jgi:hypothetical protein
MGTSSDKSPLLRRSLAQAVAKGNNLLDKSRILNLYLLEGALGGVPFLWRLLCLSMSMNVAYAIFASSEGKALMKHR